MLKQIETFLSKNIFGEHIICGNIICYGEIKLITEIVYTIIVILINFLNISIPLILLEQMLKYNTHYIKVLFLIFIIIWFETCKFIII